MRIIVSNCFDVTFKFIHFSVETITTPMKILPLSDHTEIPRNGYTRFAREIGSAKGLTDNLPIFTKSEVGWVVVTIIVICEGVGWITFRIVIKGQTALACFALIIGMGSIQQK